MSKTFYFCINPKSFILLLTNLTCSLENYPNSRSGIEKCVMVDNDWGNQADSGGCRFQHGRRDGRGRFKKW